jgi:hypothetical protein
MAVLVVFLFGAIVGMVVLSSMTEPIRHKMIGHLDVHSAWRNLARGKTNPDRTH